MPPANKRQGKEAVRKNACTVYRIDETGIIVFTNDSTDKVLFSADGFGKFGALDVEEEWACEARRYYIGIVGKHGAQVQALLKKAAALDIQTICPLHGPVLTENLGYCLNLYNVWSSYGVESEGIVIAYTSVYGNTKKAVDLLAEKLNANGCPKVVVNDLARMDMGYVDEDGSVYVSGRIADSYKNSSGETAYLFDIERAVLDILQVRQCKAVVSDISGKMIHVCHVVLDGTENREETLNRAVEHCARFFMRCSK